MYCSPLGPRVRQDFVNEQQQQLYLCLFMKMDLQIPHRVVMKAMVKKKKKKERKKERKETRKKVIHSSSEVLFGHPKE